MSAKIILCLYIKIVNCEGMYDIWVAEVYENYYLQRRAAFGHADVPGA